jgi:3-oxoacyl-[acyl-carrier protein] reductase
METSETVRQAFDLSGRVAVVTGAGSGIGRASAEVLAGAGATVYCADVREGAAEETATSILFQGAGRALARSVDVSEADEVNDLCAEAAAEHGRLDVMCNIAGTMHDSSILDLTTEELDRVLSVNLKGSLHGCQAAGRIMVEQGSGSIVNMSSAAVLTPTPGIGAYAISKAAVVQLTKTMAVEVGKKGVRVNAVAPGFVPTTMTSRYYRRPDGSIDEAMKEEVLAPMRKFSPLRRVGDPSDIAFCVLYLASDASSFLTGQSLSPNGGVAMI